MKNQLVEFLELVKKLPDEKINIHVESDNREIQSYVFQAVNNAPLAVNKLMESVELLENIIEFYEDGDLCEECGRDCKECEIVKNIMTAKQFLEDFNNEN